MDKQSLVNQVEKIRQALNVISISGYGNIKTFGNCMDALIELEKNIDSYENDIRKYVEQQIELAMKNASSEMIVNSRIVEPVSPDKPKPQRIEKEVENSGEN